MNQDQCIYESERTLDLIREINSNPNITQRYLSKKYNISLGKVNFLLNALLDRGFIKVERFKNATKKIGYIYALTPAGALKRLELTRRFLTIKAQEYEVLKNEIDQVSASYDNKDGGAA